MEFTEWMSKLKVENPDKSTFIDAVSSKIGASGISIGEIEKNIDALIKRADDEVKQSIKPSDNARN